MRIVDRPKWRVILAVSAGNALEWFDFVLYGYFAATIAKTFFPLGNEAVSLLVTLATFGVAFVVRPLGALVLGRYGDRRGRRPALLLTLSLMAAGTGIIAFAPSYSLAGIAASVLVVGGRMLQGFSAGGEFGSATAYLAEQNPHRRGFLSSMQFTGQAGVAALATLTGVLVTKALSTEQLLAWGWRIPFVLGLAVAPVAYYIRSRVAESPEFRAISSGARPNPLDVRHSWKTLLVAIGLVVVLTVGTYTLIFMPAFAVTELGLPPSTGFLASLLTSLVQASIVPVAGALSDRWGRLPIAYVATIGILFAAYPLFARMTATPTLSTVLSFQIVIGSFVAAYAGVLPALMSELFPAYVRVTGVSIGYSLAVSVFGGFAPFINALLIEATGSKVVPAFYVMSAALVTIMALTAVWKASVRIA